MNVKAAISRRPALTYFVVAFFISWFLAFLAVAPKLFTGGKIEKMDGLKMFPLMLLGPFIAAIVLTATLYGKASVKSLFARMGRLSVDSKWYLLLLLPPVTISAVLFGLNLIYPHQFTPNYFFVGIFFGIPAGLFEETGWSGFALPHLQQKLNVSKSALLLGLIWGLWHLPVIDFLGAASPHGRYLLPFLLAFIVAMAAIRTFICYIYNQTGSLLLAQLFHVISTGSLVVLGPSSITPAKECLWYLCYGIILWLLILTFRRHLYSGLSVAAKI